LLAILSYSLSLAGELYFLWPYIHNTHFPHLFPALYVHVFSSLLFSFSVVLFFRLSQNIFSWHLFWTFFLGAFSFSLFLMVGALLFLGGAFFLTPQKQDFLEEETEEEEWSQSLHIMPPDMTEEDIAETIHESLEVEPYIDILKNNDSELKKGALDQLSKIKTKESVYLIKSILKDPNPELRYCASLKLKKIEDECNEQILMFKEKLKHTKNKETHNHLGDLYSHFCSLGILDSVTSDYYYKLALNEYVLSLQEDPKQSHILKNMAKNYLAIHRPDQALLILKRACELNANDEECAILISESNLELGNWKDIQWVNS